MQTHATTEPHVEALSPAMKSLLLDLLVNSLTAELEDPFHFTATNFTYDDVRIGTAVARSAESGKPQRFSDGPYRWDWILSGFESVAQDSPVELSAIAWSDQRDRDAFRYLVAARGSADRVALPTAVAIPKLMERALWRVPTRVLVMHNHPRHPIRSLAEEALETTLGPSGLDRDTMWGWVQVGWSSGFVIEPEFWLYESGEWRRFRWPSAAQFVHWIRALSP